MKNSTKSVIVQRITHYPDAAAQAISMLTGVPAVAHSMWVAVSVNAMEVVVQAKEKADVLQALAEKGIYKVTKVVNDWN